MNSESTSVAAPLEQFLQSKSKGGDGSGNYRRNLERSVDDFLEWLEADPHSDGTFDEVNERTFRRYARDLTGRELKPGTIRTYYANVSAYIGWCVREGLLEANYAQRNVAKEPLPENDGRRSGDQQAWTDKDRTRITRYVDERAHNAVDEKGFDAIREFRDRAIVYVLCYSGVRGGEIFADPKDDRRNGLRWADVSLEDRKMTVLAKKQNWSDRSLTKQSVNPMSRYKKILDPASGDWPVFPTFHLPTLYKTLRTGLRDEHGWTPEKIETTVDELTGQHDVFEVLREYKLIPPSINTDGARRIMQRLCEDAEISLDDKHGYLAPHGGRRGAGEVMVRQRGFTAAARLLDNSEEVVRKSYSHIEAKEMARDAGDAFAEHDT
ncbi:tyrosine-type recombinase/integrase [Halosolutus amylolyticus]|uniref:Tyrosine-type recombinase/integrase n=1 Tax=Halosolutus amylolyticus TaxID=2932267 RepID=A0ABD5PJ16_9EURY|nr:phage integrase SAM-like domain-containing protein [Halosolutus amylolyticus]